MTNCTYEEWQNDLDESLDNRDNDYERELRGENEITDYEREIDYNRSQFGRVGQ